MGVLERKTVNWVKFRVNARVKIRIMASVIIRVKARIKVKIKIRFGDQFKVKFTWLRVRVEVWFGLRLDFGPTSYYMTFNSFGSGRLSIIIIIIIILLVLLLKIIAIIMIINPILFVNTLNQL